MSDHQQGTASAMCEDALSNLECFLHLGRCQSARLLSIPSVPLLLPVEGRPGLDGLAAARADRLGLALVSRQGWSEVIVILPSSRPGTANAKDPGRSERRLARQSITTGRTTGRTHRLGTGAGPMPVRGTAQSWRAHHQLTSHQPTNTLAKLTTVAPESPWPLPCPRRAFCVLPAAATGEEVEQSRRGHERRRILAPVRPVTQRWPCLAVIQNTCTVHDPWVAVWWARLQKQFVAMRCSPGSVPLLLLTVGRFAWPAPVYWVAGFHSQMMLNAVAAKNVVAPFIFGCSSHGSFSSRARDREVGIYSPAHIDEGG